MALKVKHGKVVRRDKGSILDEKNIKQSVKFIKSLGEEGQKNLAQFSEDHGNPSPTELAKLMIAEYLASEVRDYMKANLPNEPLGSDPKFRKLFPDAPLDLMTHDIADTICAENVEEILEGMVEGDGVIDDAAVHQWHRKNLDDYRDACIKLDEGAEETNALATYLNYMQAFDTYDIILDTVDDDGPSEISVLANEAGRGVIPASVSADHWMDLPEEDFPGWKAISLVPPMPISRHKLAGMFAEAAPSLHIGIVGKFGLVEPVTVEQAA